MAPFEFALDWPIRAQVALKTNPVESAALGSLPLPGARMSSTERDVSKCLEIIGEYVSPSPAQEPVKFVLKLAHSWKERGNTLAGKPRHSDRYLDDLLRLNGATVRSLTPKLAGRTHLKPADAQTLVRLFLSHWEYIGDPNSGEIGEKSADLYKPLLSNREIEAVCRYIEDRFLTVGEAELASPSATSGQDTINLIATEFQKSVALFTVGTRIVLAARPELALIGFRNLMNRLWATERADSQERILIWTLDLGRQDFDDPESRLRFMNVEALLSRFKALKRFKESVTSARWNWLESRSVIVIHDTRSVRPEVPRLPAFDPHHVLFSAIPPRWAGSPEFLALYGHERLQDTNYSIFLSKTPEDSPQGEFLDRKSSEHVHRNYELRYFGHTLLGTAEKGGQLKGLRLNPPGRSYVEALGTVYRAAAQTLGVGRVPSNLVINGMSIDPEHAIQKLRHHGFLLLRLNEFITF